MFHSILSRRPARRRIAAACCTIWLATAGCTTALFLELFGPDDPPGLAVTFSTPTANTNVNTDAPAQIRWADIASVPGTFVRLEVVRVVAASRDEISSTELIASRDALADGDSDLFEWDLTGVIVGNYQPRITIMAPDGSSDDARATGDLVVTSTLPTPTLTFTAPGAADVAVDRGIVFNITWNDNGVANAQTRITLGLDQDNPDHEQGDEIIIARDIAASDGGNAGSFNWDAIDADGVDVPDGVYFLFALLEDDVHDSNGRTIAVSAAGKIRLETP